MQSTEVYGLVSRDLTEVSSQASTSVVSAASTVKKTLVVRHLKRCFDGKILYGNPLSVHTVQSLTASWVATLANISTRFSLPSNSLSCPSPIFSSRLKTVKTDKVRLVLLRRERLPLVRILLRRGPRLGGPPRRAAVRKARQ